MEVELNQIKDAFGVGKRRRLDFEAMDSCGDI